jgi:hypothetical protein
VAVADAGRSAGYLTVNGTAFIQLGDSGAGADTAPVTGRSYLASQVPGVTGSFRDQYGNPRLLLFDSAWCLPANAGRWNGGDWQEDYNFYLKTRANQGMSAWLGVPWGNLHIGGAYDNGRTWDGIYPLTIDGTPGTIATGSEVVALNDPFWQRIDYFAAQALTWGISLFMNLGLSYDMSAGQIWGAATATQAQAFGAALATRYPQASYPNIIWHFGDDYNGQFDTQFAAMLAGLQGAGDTRPLGIEYEPEQDSQFDLTANTALASPRTFGAASATFNWVYTYNVAYFCVEQSYKEAGALTVVYGDGFYWGESGGTGASSDENVMRRMKWWAIASGARGLVAASHYVWNWDVNARAALTSETWYPAVNLKFRQLVESLPNWNLLVPDTGNVFVTAGRGTRATGLTSGGAGGTNYGPADAYVAASLVADGSLAVLYCGQAFSVTVNQAKMQAGYSAYWVDPESLVATPVTAAATYSSAGRGNNSAGQPDWALILVGPPSVTTASLPDAAEGTPYSQILTGAGGVPPYTWQVSSGSLPPWATLI